MAVVTCGLNIYMVTIGQSFVEVCLSDLCENSRLIDLSLRQTRVFLTIAIGLQVTLDMLISITLVAKIERQNLRQ